MPSVAYLGPQGTFTYQACRQHFDAIDDSYTFAPVENLADIIHAVHNGDTEYGVIPFENSTNGHVVPTLDLFRQLDPERVQVVSEIYLSIHQCLLSTSKHLSEIQRLYSHPQAFGQCERFLQAHLEDIKRINVSSTGEAAQLAARDPNSAAVASASSAEAANLAILQADIEDNANNTTRFLVLRTAAGHAGAQAQTTATGPQKTLARLTVPHAQPGSLAQLLQKFGAHGLNLTSICSRPLPLTNDVRWQYVFFFEFEGGSAATDVRVRSILKEVQAELLAERLDLLGCFTDLRRQANPSS